MGQDISDQHLQLAFFRLNNEVEEVFWEGIRFLNLFVSYRFFNLPVQGINHAESF